MKRLFLVPVTALLFVCASLAQTTMVHTSGGDGTSWALIRVGNGQVAHIGDIDGIHIGDVARDELIIVRNQKAFIVTDNRVLGEVEAARVPVSKLSEERSKLRTDERKVREEQRGVERERRDLQRAVQRLDRNVARADDNQKRDIERQKADITHKESDLDRKFADLGAKHEAAVKKVEAVEKQREAARTEMQKKVEKIFDDAISKGLAKPFGS